MKKKIRKYLNLIIEDFFERDTGVRIYKDISPALRSERSGLKIVVIYEQKILHGKNGRPYPGASYFKKKKEN